MNTQHLRYLLAIAEQGSINKAAKALYLSRSSLNIALKTLEDDLGYPLFVRSATGVTPTEAGKKVIEEARTVLSIIDGWHAQSEETITTINLYVVPTINLLYSVPLVADYRRDHPNTDFHCRETTNAIDVIPSNLNADNALMIGGYYTRDREALYRFVEEKGYGFHELFQSHFVVYLNASHPCAGQPCIKYEDFQKMDLIVLNEFNITPFFNDLSIRTLNTTSSIPIIFNHIASNAQAATLLPDILEEPLDLSARHIVSRPLADTDTDMHYFLVYKQKTARKKAVRAFIDNLLCYPFRHNH